MYSCFDEQMYSSCLQPAPSSELPKMQCNVESCLAIFMLSYAIELACLLALTLAYDVCLMAKAKLTSVNSGKQI